MKWPSTYDNPSHVQFQNGSELLEVSPLVRLRPHHHPDVLVPGVRPRQRRGRQQRHDGLVEDRGREMDGRPQKQWTLKVWQSIEASHIFG